MMSWRRNELVDQRFHLHRRHTRRNRYIRKQRSLACEEEKKQQQQQQKQKKKQARQRD